MILTLIALQTETINLISRIYILMFYNISTKFLCFKYVFAIPLQTLQINLMLNHVMYCYVQQCAMLLQFV